MRRRRITVCTNRSKSPGITMQKRFSVKQNLLGKPHYCLLLGSSSSSSSSSHASSQGKRGDAISFPSLLGDLEVAACSTEDSADTSRRSNWSWMIQQIRKMCEFCLRTFFTLQPGGMHVIAFVHLYVSWFYSQVVAMDVQGCKVIMGSSSCIIFP